MSKMQVNELLNVAGDNVPDNLLPVTAGAWVNMDFTGGASIIDSHNVSSVTDEGGATSNVNFITAFANGDYAVITGCMDNGANAMILNTNDGVPPTGSTCRLIARNNSGSSTDPIRAYAAFFGGQ